MFSAYIDEGMSMIFKNFWLFFLLSLFIVLQGVKAQKKEAPVTPEAVTEKKTTICRSEIRYTWKAAGEDSTPLDVSYAIVETQAESEAAAKAELSRKIAAERSAASNRCRHTHENLAGCISTKYASMTSILNALSFSARGELEKAIAQDCGKQTGRCISTASSEPECSTKANTEEKTAETEEKK
jgi:hypothetical protein